jgi:protein TonB
LIYAATPRLPSDDDALPEPAQDPFAALAPSVLPPPPPPPPPPTSARPSPARTPTTSAEPRPIRAGAGIAEPRKRRHVSPVYPAQALAARVQGVVILECTISTAGEVVDVRTLRGDPLLVDAAVAAVKQWQYEPSLLNGVAVPVIMTVTVNFKLS